MTPYEKAQQLSALIVDKATDDGLDLPSSRQILSAEPVVAEECFLIALTELAIPEEFAPDGFCAAPQLATFDIIIARDCSATFNDDGTTNIAAAAVVAEANAADADFLWEWANQYDPYLEKEWSIGFANTGAVSITSMQFTTGVD